MARRGFAALVEGRLKLARHQPQPVAIDQHLVLGVDGGDRILAILDRGQRRLEHDVADARRIGPANLVRAVDMDFDMQAMMDQQKDIWGGGRADITGETRRIGKGADRAIGKSGAQGAAFDKILADVLMRGARQRGDPVQKRAAPRNDFSATPRIVAFGAGVGRRQGVGSIERVIKRAPTGVGGVQRIARVGDRHDQLRTGLRGYFHVNLCRADFEIGGLGAR